MAIHNGDIEMPTEIRTLTELQNVDSDLTADYILKCDIDAAGASFTPIGAGSSFTGTFDGNCHVNWLDFITFAGEWLDTGSGLQADLNRDSVVNWLDFLIFAGNWLWSK